MKARSHLLGWLLPGLAAMLLVIGCSAPDSSGPGSKIGGSYFVSQAEASQLALGFMQAHSKAALPNGVQVAQVVPVNDAKGHASIYVVQFQHGGFVLIAADRRVPPIVAYSEKNSFPMGQDVVGPMALDGWVTQSVKRIEGIRREERLAVDEAVTRQWDALATEHRVAKGDLSSKSEAITSCTPTSRTVGPWMSTTWNQGCGYNFYEPTGCTGYDMCSKSWTGCEATAAAQVMRYFRYPGAFNWGAMPNAIGGHANSGLNLSDFPPGTGDVAQLMRSVGVASSMNYGCDKSVTQTSYVRSALVDDFGYQSAAYGGYDFSTVRYNLNAAKPVILDGSDKNCILFVCYPGEGHAWVTDGYREDTICLSDGSVAGYDYLYMNWGWGGSYDGYYNANVGYWTPDGENLTNYNHMIYDITPASCPAGYSNTQPCGESCCMSPDSYSSCGSPGYISFYSGSNCTGTEYYYLSYFTGTSGVPPPTPYYCRPFNSAGARCGSQQYNNVTWYSYRYCGTCYNHQSTNSYLVRVYR